MKTDLFFKAGFIDVTALGSVMDPLLVGTEISREDGNTRIDIGEFELPTFDDAVEVLGEELWLNVERAAGVVTLTHNGAQLAVGAGEDNLSIIDVSKILEAAPECTLVKAVETNAWVAGDCGGSAEYHGSHYSNYTDTAEVMDTSEELNTCIAAERYSDAAAIITNQVESMLDGIRDPDARSAVALELVEEIAQCCRDHMNPEDAEADANRF